jgi:pyruvate/2-oxoglutarate dehydrogenase complex dihydrolipoamide dehydrogenase (E3) component
MKKRFVSLLLATAGGEIRAEARLIATGRSPNTRALDAQRTGVLLDERGTLRVAAACFGRRQQLAQVLCAVGLTQPLRR